MSEVVCNQGLIFIYSILGGIIIGFVFDIFRLKRKMIKTNNFITICIEDFVYWLLVAFIMFYVLEVSNDGEIRGFLILGHIIGVIIYFLMLSEFIIKLLVCSIKIVYNIIIKVLKIILYPFYTVYKIFRCPVMFLLRWIFWILRKIKNRLKIEFDKIAIFIKVIFNKK